MNTQKRTLHGPWAAAAQRVGIHSFRTLAERSGLGIQTVINVVSGEAYPRGETVDALAHALHVDVGAVWSWVGDPKPADTGEFVPHAWASRLTARQRAAVNQLIVAMVEPTKPLPKGAHEDAVTNWEQYGLAARKVDKKP